MPRGIDIGRLTGAAGGEIALQNIGGEIVVARDRVDRRFIAAFPPRGVLSPIRARFKAFSRRAYLRRNGPSRAVNAL